MFHLIKLLTLDSRKCLTHLIAIAVQETHLEFLFTRDIWILSLSRMSHLIGIVCCNKPQVMLSPFFAPHSSSQSASFGLCLSLQQSYEETSQIKSKVCFRQQLQDCCIVFMTHDCWWCCCEADDGIVDGGHAPPSVVVMQQLARFIDVSNSFSGCVYVLWQSECLSLETINTVRHPDRHSDRQW